MKQFILLLTLPLFFLNVNAQSKVKGKYKRISLDVYGGMPFFNGDISNEIAGYNATSRLNWNISSGFSIGGEFSYGQVKGANEKYYKEYFKTKYMKALIGTEIYFFNALGINDVTNWFQPYLGLSVGAIKADVEDSGSDLGVNTNHYNDWAPAQQFTIGAKFKLSKTFDLNVRYAITSMQTDLFENLEPDYFKNNANDALTNVDLGLTVHFGGKGKGKGKNPIIWKPSDAMNDDLAKKDEQDSLKLKLDELNEKLNKELAEVNASIQEQDDSKNDLHQKLEGLQNQIDELEDKLLNDNNTKNTNIDGSSNPDGVYETEDDVYEADLNGDIDAKFYIVVGSFAVAKNASSKVKELQNKNYTPFIMTESSATKFNRVVIDYTNDFNTAVEKVNRYRQELDPKSWLIKQRNY